MSTSTISLAPDSAPGVLSLYSFVQLCREHVSLLHECRVKTRIRDQVDWCDLLFEAFHLETISQTERESLEGLFLKNVDELRNIFFQIVRFVEKECAA